MYKQITGENPYKTPMKIYPAIHYTMGGLWVDYNLMSNLPGLFVIGEANFSDHGANRLGASALMQGLADGAATAIPTTGGRGRKGGFADVYDDEGEDQAHFDSDRNLNNGDRGMEMGSDDDDIAS